MKQSALPMDGLPPRVLLESEHYLGKSHRATLAWEDEVGVMVFAAPTARNLPKDWLELVRWCLLREDVGSKEWDGPIAPGADHRPRNWTGSQQWKAAKRWLLSQSAATTVVSYSDPSVGHTGALYRASGWLWAPTWHRLFPPPSGQGRWTSDGKAQAAKDRWVSLLRPDDTRSNVLAVNDARIKRMTWAEYREPRWKRGHPLLHTGGGDYQRWRHESTVLGRPEKATA